MFTLAFIIVKICAFKQTDSYNFTPTQFYTILVRKKDSNMDFLRNFDNNKLFPTKKKLIHKITFCFSFYALFSRS